LDDTKNITNSMAKIFEQTLSRGIHSAKHLHGKWKQSVHHRDLTYFSHFLAYKIA